jgi:hypothetical protein
MSDLIERAQASVDEVPDSYWPGSTKEQMQSLIDTLEAMQKEVSYLRTRETNHMVYIAELEEQLDNEREAALFWQAKARTHDDAKQTLKGDNDE